MYDSVALRLIKSTAADTSNTVYSYHQHDVFAELKLCRMQLIDLADEMLVSVLAISNQVVHLLIVYYKTDLLTKTIIFVVFVMPYYINEANVVVIILCLVGMPKNCQYESEIMSLNLVSDSVKWSECDRNEIVWVCVTEMR